LAEAQGSILRAGGEARKGMTGDKWTVWCTARVYGPLYLHGNVVRTRVQGNSSRKEVLGQPSRIKTDVQRHLS
jgi:hypothetical protein